MVNVADGWRERNVWYQGLVSEWKQSMKFVSNNEWQEVRRGHSTIVIALKD